uniref:Uncharacterized protein n=1 Tax=Meloidogyne enterolobii TaxID=390850 RepID=A0A6V7XR54_MELEN|nr:unnamed protein product [Meloidogyne enterolobii]
MFCCLLIYLKICKNKHFLIKNFLNYSFNILTIFLIFKVKDNDVDAAFHVLNRLMEREGLIKVIRNTRYFLKPYMQRNQYAKEASEAIIDEDRERKFKFLTRKNRADAYPGQITH